MINGAGGSEGIEEGERERGGRGREELGKKGREGLLIIICRLIHVFAAL